MLKAIKTDLNYDIPHDNKNSGQALAQILAEKNNPVGDIGYFGVTFGMKAKAQDALEPYKPAHWNEVPAGLKDEAKPLFCSGPRAAARPPCCVSLQASNCPTLAAGYCSMRPT
jgi:ABC-type Fe3+ transport system substrate-binding protein